MPFEPPAQLNIADYFLGERLREGRGDRVALRIGERTWSYEDVALYARRYRRALDDLGLRREERVLLALPDGFDFVGAFFGVLEGGAVVVMVNPQLTAESLARLMDYTGATAAIVDSDDLDRVDEALALATARPHLLVVGSESAEHARFDPEGPAAEGPAIATHRDDPAIWLFSGGTTGLPKAVVQTHRSFAYTTECYAKKALGYREDDITLSVPKLYFGYATGSNLLFPFSVGASAVLFPEHPTAEILFEQIRRHRPTILINVPKMIYSMVSHPAAQDQDLSCLRFATSAGEALPIPLYDQWKERFGVELLDGLGTAEMWHVFVSNVPGDVKPGTLGKPVPGFEVRVLDDEGNTVPDGRPGRLWVRGGARAICYWRNMPRTQEAFRGEWFVGGDLVQRDADGYITYCGRSDDVLKVGGKWLAPQEVESCLMRHPAVRECAVIGAEGEQGLTQPVAFVVADSDRPELVEQLKQHVLEHLEPYKHPRRVYLVDELPRTHLGKVDRGELKRRAER